MTVFTNCVGKKAISPKICFIKISQETKGKFTLKAKNSTKIGQIDCELDLLK